MLNNFSIIEIVGLRFQKNDNTVKHFRDVRGIMKNVEEFKEVYGYSDGVSGPKILIMKFVTKIDEHLNTISTYQYVPTSESGEKYENLDEKERKHILYDDEWNDQKKKK